MSPLNEPRDVDSTAQDAAPAKDGEERAATRMSELWTSMEPAAGQAWANLRVWVPFLSNPDLRNRTLKYVSRDCREGLHWHVDLPRQCWMCGSETGLTQTIDREIRSFEYPVPILSVVGAIAGLFFLMAIWFPSFAALLLCVIVGAVGAVALFVKSWLERVTLTPFVCQQHSSQQPEVSLVVHDSELFVTLPTEKLASAAQAELTARRRSRQPAGMGLGPASLSATQPWSGRTPPALPTLRPTVPASREELPPLKVDGDEPAPPPRPQPAPSEPTQPEGRSDDDLF